MILLAVAAASVARQASRLASFDTESSDSNLGMICLTVAMPR